MTDAEVFVLLARLEDGDLLEEDRLRLAALDGDRLLTLIAEHHDRRDRRAWEELEQASVLADLGVPFAAPAWVRDLTNRLNDADYDGLVAWLRKVGVPGPHMYADTPEDLDKMRWIIRKEAHSFPDLRTPPGGSDWYSYVADHSPTLGRKESAGSIAELVQIVESSTPAQRIRVVGAGHAGSDVAKATGCLLVGLFELDDVALPGLPDDANDVPQLIRADYRAAFGLAADEDIVRICAGLSVKESNRRLRDAGFAFRNLGSYDGQSIAGAALTGTHGSGAWMGPIADEIASVDLVAVDEVAGQRRARLVRVEGSTRPLTDPAAFANWQANHPEWELIQDDDLLASLAVSFGCLGIVFAVSLRVRESFWLSETLTFKSTDEVIAETPAKLTEDGLYYEVLYNPYRGDDHPEACLVRERRRAPAGVAAPERTWPGVLQWTKDKGPKGTAQTAATAQTVLGAAGAIQQSLNTQHTRHDGMHSIGYEVLRLGIGLYFTAPSMEVALPVDRLADAFHGIRAQAVNQFSEPERPFHTSPVGFRFVGASQALLAANHGDSDEVFLFVETPMLFRSRDPIARIESCLDVLLALGGRPHWGQYNTLASHADVVQYWGTDNVNRWKAARDQLDPHRALSNGLSDKLGL